MRVELGFRRITAAFLVATYCSLSTCSFAQTCTFAVAAASFSDFSFNGVNDPTIRLFRGFRYQFNVTSGGPHPFWIKSIQGTTSANAYNDGVIGNGTTSGTLTFQVPTNAPNVLFYNCQNHSGMTGQFLISDPPPVAILNAYLQGDEMVISSVGTNLLRTQVEALQDLANGMWEVIPIITNQFADGTNTTVVGPVTTNLLLNLRIKACRD